MERAGGGEILITMTRSASLYSRNMVKICGAIFFIDPLDVDGVLRHSHGASNMFGPRVAMKMQESQNDDQSVRLRVLRC